MRLFANAVLKENTKDENNRCRHDNEFKARNTFESIADDHVKPYEVIPGPNGIFGIGTFYHYFPIVGMQMNQLSGNLNIYQTKPNVFIVRMNKITCCFFCL